MQDKLADGLHLIDFEQLKIENQTLNEKIEERNDELYKLRKKTTTTVQVLTHVKEKLQFITRINTKLGEEYKTYDEQVARLRDELADVSVSHSFCQCSSVVFCRQNKGGINSEQKMQNSNRKKASLEAMF